MSNISFGSMFNPERIRGKSIEKELNNPELNLEHLQKGRELSRLLPSFPDDSAGRCQVRKGDSLTSINMSDEDLALLRSLSSNKYGFSPDGESFWVHSKKVKEDGTYTFTMSDGKLEEGADKKEFIEKLIGDDAKGLNVVGKDKNGNPVALAFVYNEDTKGTTIYSSEYKEGEACLEYMGKDGFREAIADGLKNLKSIKGATVWK